MKLLYICSHPNFESLTTSTSVAKAFLEAYKIHHEDYDITNLELYRTPPPLIDKEYLSAMQKSLTGEELSLEEREQLEISSRIVDQFIDADRFLVAVPMWNFGVPPLLKAYIDNIVSVNKSFRYTPNGPEGLLNGQGKKAVIIQSSGGVYSDKDARNSDHCSTFLTRIFQFVGIESVQTIFVEGVDQFRERRDEIILSARKEAEALASSF